MFRKGDFFVPGYQTRSPKAKQHTGCSLSLNVQVPCNWVLGIWVIVIVVQVLGKYMIIKYLDPSGDHDNL